MAGEHEHDVVGQLRRRAHEQLLVLVRALRGDAQHDAPVAEARSARARLALGQRPARGRERRAVVDDAERAGSSAELGDDLVARGLR